MAALFILFAAVFVWQEKGVFAVAFLVVLRGSYEMARMFFNQDYPSFSKAFFVILAGFAFLIVSNENLRGLSGLIMILFFLVVVCSGILFHKSFTSPSFVLTFVTKCAVGLIYTCYLPATVMWTLQTNNGLEWFFCLLTVVFAGDIGAYLFGSQFGKTKIAPALSPNKSLQGGLGGLCFSVIAALIFGFFLLQNTPLWVLAGCGLFGGFLGQVGDFFESLIKRTAGVKDSGSIMPGHGGVLDRLDGVLLSAPLFYLAATYYSL